MSKVAHRSLAAGLLSLFANFSGHTADAAGAWNLRAKSAAPVVISASIDTIEPASTWSGAASAVPTVDTTTVLGQQTITGAASNGGLIRLTVASTATMSDGELWTVDGVQGTTEANGEWRVRIVDGTHVDLCANLTGNEGAYSCTGSTFSNAYTSSGTIGFTEQAIGNFDTPPYTWIEDGAQTITVAAGAGTRANIADVVFCLEGTCKTVTQQTIAPNTTSQGWSITPISRTAAAGGNLNGDADLYAVIEPVNGSRRRIGPLRLHLNSNAAAAKLPRNNYYVDSINGSDSLTKGAAVNNPSSPFKTIQKALGTASNDSGAVFNLAAPTYGCTITAASPAVVTCPTTALVSPATIRLSSVPVGLFGVDANTTYYIDQDGFSSVSGTSSFEISTSPPGVRPDNPPVASNGAPGVSPYFPSATISTSGTGGTVNVIGAMYTEDVSGGSLSGATRSVTVKPIVPGTVTMTRTTASTNNLQFTAQLIVFEDMTFDMSKFRSFSPGLTPQYLTFSHSRFVDPNGPVPPYGYSNSVANGPLTNITTAAFIDSVSSYYEGPTATLMRNVRAWYGFDAYQFGVSAANDNRGVFNYHATKTQAWLSTGFQSDAGPLDMKVVSVSGVTGTCSHNPSQYQNCTTDVTIQNVKNATTSSDLAFVVYSGVMNARYFLIGNIFNTSGVAASGSNPVTGVAIVRVYGDLTALSTGDQVFIGGQGHSDAFQEVGVGESYTGVCANGNNHNLTMQRYLVDRTSVVTNDPGYGTPDLAIQGTLAQGGYCINNKGGNTAPLTASGTSVTISGTTGGFYYGQLQPGSVIVAGTKADGTALTAVVATATTKQSGTGKSSTATLTAPFDTDDGTGNLNTTNWMVRSELVASGTTVTITGASSYQILPDDILAVGRSSGGLPLSARVKSATANGFNHTVTLYTPFPTADGTYSSNGAQWAIGRGAIGVLFQNVSIDQNAGSLFQFSGAQVHWVYQNVTFTGFLSNYPGSGSGWGFRTDFGNYGFGNENLAVFDSILPSIDSYTPLTGLPTGTVLDNVTLTNGKVPTPAAGTLYGTNINGSDYSATPIVTFDARRSPITGAKPHRKTPILPFDYYGQPRTISNSIGAVN